MTAKTLENYTSIKKEIHTIDQRLTNIKKSGIVADTVQASRHEIPYNQQIIKIEGLSERAIHECEQLELKQQMRLNRLKTLAIEIENFINEITDSQIRQIIEYRFIQGRSWRSTSVKVYGYPSESRARVALHRYLKKHTKEAPKC